MAEFNVGDWVYAHDWCYGQIVDLTDDEATVEFETIGGGGCYSFDITDLKEAPEPKTKISIRDNLLITAGARAGHMSTMDIIELPCGLEGEDILAEFITNAVGTYLKLDEDIPFDFFIEEALFDKFGKEKSDESTSILGI